MTKILVAEDEYPIRAVLVDILLDVGYEVIEAMDGGTALQKACHEHPDIILLDMMMPVMDGFQVLEKLQNDPATKSMPVIMVSAKGHEEDQLRATSLGASDYITKPWEPDEVESKVMRMEIAIAGRSAASI